MIEVLPPAGELVTDLPELSKTMGRVASAATLSDLDHLKYGLRAYAAVTEAVTEDIEKGNFDDPHKMARTMPVFAERIFAPLRHHANGETDQVGAWSQVFYTEAAQKALPSAAMVDFLGFHVLYDLPFALRDTDTQPEHKKDYSRKINLILAKVGRDLLPEYIDVHPVLERARASEIGLGMVMAHLIMARSHAWKSFQRLQAADQLDDADTSQGPADHRLFGRHPQTVEEIDQELSLLAAKRMLSTKKTANYILRRAGRVPERPWTQPEATF